MWKPWYLDLHGPASETGIRTLGSLYIARDQVVRLVRICFERAGLQAAGYVFFKLAHYP